MEVENETSRFAGASKYVLDDELLSACVYYARVTQEPLEWPDMAWSSPIWIDVG